MKIHEASDNFIVDNITDLYLDATRLGEELASRDWYAKAYKDCETIAGVLDLPTDVFIGVVAALSPRMTWYYNIANAVRLVNGLSTRAYGRNTAKGKRILRGEEPLSVLGGNKVRAFYRNIRSRGEDCAEVTIDTWALKVALGQEAWGDKISNITDKQYHRLEGAYKAVASEFAIRPTELQSVTWVHIKNQVRSQIDARQLVLGLGV